MDDLQNIFFEIYDKYNEQPLVEDQYVDKENILFAFENALIKVVRYVTHQYPYVLWDNDYRPIIYVLNSKNSFIKIFDPYQLNRNFYLLLLSFFRKELKKEIYYANIVKDYKKFRNRLLHGVINNTYDNYYEVLLNNNDDGRIVSAVLNKRQTTPLERRNVYKQDLKLFFTFYSLDMKNNIPCLLLTRNSPSLPVFLIRYQILDLIHGFKQRYNYSPVLKCVKRVPNHFSVIVVNDHLFIPKKVFQDVQNILYGENIYVYNTKDIERAYR